MATVCQILDTKWRNENTNEMSLDANASQFFSTITGNVDEKVSLEGRVRTWTYVELKDYYVYSKTDSPNGSIFCKGAFVKGSGINVGDRVRWVFSNNLDYTDTVISVSGDIIYMAGNSWNVDMTAVADYLFVISDLNDCIYDFGLFQDTTSFESKLDGSIQSYKVKGLDHVTKPFIEGEAIGKNWRNGLFRMSFVNYAKVPFSIWKDTNGNDWQVAQDFYFRHDFIIQNYTESQGQEIIDGLTPLDYLGKLTYSYCANIQLFKSLEEPATIKQKQFTSDGNIGWYNENFNGTQTNKSISNVEFKRFGNDEIIDSLCVERTKIKFNISNCNGATNVVLRHKRLLKSEDYYQVNELYNDIFFNQIVRLTNSTPINYGAYTNAKITLNGTVLTVEAELGIDDSELLEQDYLLSVSVEENKENRVNLIVKTGQYIGGFDVDGLVEDATFTFTHRAYSQPFTKLQLMLDEIVGLDFNFALVNSLGAELQDLEVRTVLTNGVENITLNTDVIDLNSIILVAGVQRIDTIITDRYNIEDGYFKYLNSTSTKSNYNLKLNYRVPSQDNIFNDDIPEVFFDILQKNNGLNEDSFTKQANGYEIKIGLYLVVSGTEYLFLTEKIEIINYEQSI